MQTSHRRDKDRRSYLAGWDEVGQIAEVAVTRIHRVRIQHPDIDTKFILLLAG